MSNIAEKDTVDFPQLSEWLKSKHEAYQDLYEKIRTNVRAKASAKSLDSTADAVQALLNSDISSADKEQMTAAQKYIIGRFIVDRAPLLLGRHRHQCMRDAILKNFRRIEQSIIDEKSDYANYDFFVKDIAYVYGELIPCGAPSVSLNGEASVRSLLSHEALKAYPNPFAWAKATFQLGRKWFRPHTDSRVLEEFNEAGWDKCYKYIAVLLEENPDMLGMAGTGWFYDPQILHISPRLGYLQARPLERGAFLFRHGPDPFYTAMAVEKSETRRKLVEEGKYIPQGYSLIWPREALLNWAKNN